MTKLPFCLNSRCILCLCCMIVIGAVIGVSVSVAVIPAGALVAVPTPGPLPGQARAWKLRIPSSQLVPSIFEDSLKIPWLPHPLAFT